jgi:hypothetical protein
MAAIALPAFHITTTRKLSVEVNHELSQDLEQYRAFYRQAYGAEVSEADLLREMARRFMQADREFQGFKTGARPRSRDRARRTAPAAGPSLPAEVRAAG